MFSSPSFTACAQNSSRVSPAGAAALAVAVAVAVADAAAVEVAVALRADADVEVAARGLPLAVAVGAASPPLLQEIVTRAESAARTFTLRGIPGWATEWHRLIARAPILSSVRSRHAGRPTTAC